MPKFDFNKVAKAALLKSHFCMGVLLYIYCIFSEHPFLGAPLGGCFCRWEIPFDLFHFESFICYLKF